MFVGLSQGDGLLAYWSVGSFSRCLFSDDTPLIRLTYFIQFVAIFLSSDTQTRGTRDC